VLSEQPLGGRTASSTATATTSNRRLQADAAYSLVQQLPTRAGFASGCQVFGHRELLGVLRGFGLVMNPALTRPN
jgi:hypothetical protein